MPCGVGFLASSKANVLVEGSSSKTKSDWLSIFEGSKVPNFSVDNTVSKVVYGGILNGGLGVFLFSLGDSRDDIH